MDKAGTDDKLSETIDYEELYKIIREAMGKPSRLLENIGGRIMEVVFAKFPLVTYVELSISKKRGGVTDKDASSRAACPLRAPVRLRPSNSLDSREPKRYTGLCRSNLGD